MTIVALPVFFQGSVAVSRKIIVSLAAAMMMATVVLWYFYWVPFLQSIGHHNYFFMGVTIREGILYILSHPVAFAKRFFVDSFKYVGVAALAIGGFLAFKKGKLRIALSFSIPLVAMLLFITKLGFAFTLNGYYFVTVVPVLCFVTGYGLSMLSDRRMQLALLGIVAIENMANQVHLFQQRPYYEPLLQLEQVMNEAGSQPRDLVAVVNPDTSPMAIYFSHRKGINLAEEEARNTQKMAELKSKGFKYLIILKTYFPESTAFDYQVAYDSDEFKIYKL
jgi:hypothetical protein